MISRFWAWVTGRKEFLLTDGEAIGRAGLEENFRSSVWDVVSWTCLSVIQVDLSSGQSDIQVEFRREGL